MDHWLFVAKGVIAVLGLALLLLHMLTGDEEMSFARTLRYVALCAAAGSSALASVGQVDGDEPWLPRHWGALTACTLILLASIASLLEDVGITLSRTKGNR